MRTPVRVILIEKGGRVMESLRFPLRKDTSRKIIHIDMDAFFASVEERNHPEYVGKPLVIARHPKETGGKGVVSTANYEARKYGIHSALSAQKAYELCPEARFVHGNYEEYRQVSQEIQAIFYRYTDMVEPMSLDEAYLDVTENKLGIESAMKIAKMIQADIWREVRLTCSAGISYNKFIAKIASDYQKPKGFTVVLPAEAEAFLAALPIEKFHGVGKKTIPIMHEMGIFTGADLAQVSEMTLIRRFGKMGYSLFRKVRGIHDAPVNPVRERKSMGRERTFGQPLVTENQLTEHLRKLAKDVARSLHKNQRHGQTIVLKLRDSEFRTMTRRRTLDHYVDQEEEIFYLAQSIWEELEEDHLDVRLLGITVTNLEMKTYEPIVLPLWQKK